MKDGSLHIIHHSLLAGHPGGRKAYHRIRNDLYRPALAVNCYDTVPKCPHCAKNQINMGKNVMGFRVLPEKDVLTSVCTDILADFIKSPRRTEYLSVNTDRFSKMIKTVPTKSISAAEVARQFVNSWVFNCDRPAELIRNNEGWFTSKFFKNVCNMMLIQNNFTAMYHPQSNGQVEGKHYSSKAYN